MNVYLNVCRECAHIWVSAAEPGSEKEPGWCPDCHSEEFDAQETPLQAVLDNLEELIEAAEDVTRCSQVDVCGIAAWVVGEERIARLKAAVEKFARPYHLEGGRRLRGRV